jgi:hypothetical protein
MSMATKLRPHKSATEAASRLSRMGTALAPLAVERSLAERRAGKP